VGFLGPQSPERALKVSATMCGCFRLRHRARSRGILRGAERDPQFGCGGIWKKSRPAESICLSAPSSTPTPMEAIETLPPAPTRNRQQPQEGVRAWPVTPVVVERVCLCVCVYVSVHVRACVCACVRACHSSAATTLPKGVFALSGVLARILHSVGQRLESVMHCEECAARRQRLAGTAVGSVPGESAPISASAGLWPQNEPEIRAISRVCRARCAVQTLPVVYNRPIWDSFNCFHPNCITRPFAASTCVSSLSIPYRSQPRPTVPAMHPAHVESESLPLCRLSKACPDEYHSWIHNCLSLKVAESYHHLHAAVAPTPTPCRAPQIAASGAGGS
jgi:hypothetical protein